MSITHRVHASAQTVDEVLRKIAATIADDPQRYGVANVYTAKSCYGAVAHHLKTHPKLKDGFIMLFAVSEDYDDIVSHALLMGNSGKAIIDQFEAQGKGKVHKVNGRIVYEHIDPKNPGKPFVKPLLISMSVGTFRTTFDL